MISRQERVNFVDFQEMTLPKSQSLILDAPKKLFSKSREASFLARRLRSMDFQSMLCIWKMFLRVQGIFWYQLYDYTTRRNDFAAGKSDFCRFSRNDTSKSNFIVCDFQPICFWKMIFLILIFRKNGVSDSLTDARFETSIPKLTLD